MSRQNEIYCLEKVKSCFFRCEQAKIEFNNSDVLIEKILLSSRDNKNNNDFPDFFFDGGIIEHFQVTASAETKKGSSFRIEEEQNKKQAEENFRKADKEFQNSKHVPNTFSVAENLDEYENFSYEAFLFSFKKNFINHYQSLIKSDFLGKTVVFLIEQDDSRLGIWNGNTFLRFYSIHEDKNVLEFLKEYSNQVRIIIFIAVDGIEIIDLSKIDSLLSKAKSNLDIRSGHSKHLQLKIYLDI